MSRTKFTPGPWSIHRQACTAVVGSSGFVVAACGGYSTSSRDPDDLLSELEANARLVAAAPYLYEAAEAAWNCIAELPPTQARVEVAQMLCAALTKARGES